MTEFKPVEEGEKHPKEVSIEQLILMGSPQNVSSSIVCYAYLVFSHSGQNIYHIK